MTSREFYMWLEGYLDNRGKLCPSEVNAVKDYLSRISDDPPVGVVSVGRKQDDAP